MRKATGEKCSACGANLRFDISSQDLICDYCGETKSVISGEVVEKRQLSALDKQLATWNEESSVIKCQNCGAQSVVSGSTIASTCAFCGSYNLVKTEELPGLKPNGIIPFKFTEKQTEESFKKWIKTKRFRPNKLKTTKISTFVGIYTPCWVYDSSVSTSYSGEFYNERTDSEGHTERDYFNVSGTRDDSFKDVAVNVGDKIDEAYFNTLKPFDFKAVVPYSSAYLLSFSASHYRITADVAFNKAQKYMEDRIRDFITVEQHADGCSSLNTTCSYNNDMYSYLLLPIWIMSYKFNDKIYNIMSNGQTGEVTGKTPRSPIKIVFSYLITFIIGALFMTFVDAVFGGVITFIAAIIMLALILSE